MGSVCILTKLAHLICIHATRHREQSYIHIASGDDDQICKLQSSNIYRLQPLDRAMCPVLYCEVGNLLEGSRASLSEHHS